MSNQQKKKKILSQTKNIQTATPAGFLERFKEIFEKGSFPLEVGELRLATEPLYTVAKGTLIAAIADSKRNR